MQTEKYLPYVSSTFNLPFIEAVNQRCWLSGLKQQILTLCLKYTHMVPSNNHQTFEAGILTMDWPNFLSVPFSVWCTFPHLLLLLPCLVWRTHRQVILPSYRRSSRRYFPRKIIPERGRERRWTETSRLRLEIGARAIGPEGDENLFASNIHNHWTIFNIQFNDLK